MTFEERRSKLTELAFQDPEFRSAWEEYEQAKLRFEKRTHCLPKKLRSQLWSYPGMGYFVYHRMLDLVCERMVFRDEAQSKN